MNSKSFSTTFSVPQPATEVFNAVINVRGWWSEEIEGNTEKVNDEFTYHFQDIHLARMRLIDVIRNERIAWLVLDNRFNFTKDKNEWIGNEIIFEISEKDNQTQLRFTQVGLTPEYECYDACSNAWGYYIGDSLRNLITSGKGKPIRKGGSNEFEEGVIRDHDTTTITKQDFQLSVAVDATPNEAFGSINNVSGWWTQNLEGSSQKLNDEFEVRFGDVHYSRQKVVELVPAKKVVWLVTDSRLNFIRDKQEWTNTRISFEIHTRNRQTQIVFSHTGLIPGIECFDACTNAWSQYIQGSLVNLVNTGTGQPALAEKQTENAKP